VRQSASVRIAGRFVAARDHWDSGAPDFCYGIAVAVMNLAAAPDGQGLLGQRYREERGNCEGKEELDLPTSIVVKRNGAVAYLRCDASPELGFGGPYRCRPGSTRVVVKHDARDARNAFEVLDSAPSIASLRPHGGTLSWRNGSQLRTARLK